MNGQNLVASFAALADSSADISFGDRQSYGWSCSVITRASNDAVAAFNVAVLLSISESVFHDADWLVGAAVWQPSPGQSSDLAAVSVSP